MNKTLGFYYFVHNIIQYEYPLVESVRSINPIADEIVICECDSSDNTMQVLRELQAEVGDKLKIVYHSWVTDFRELSVLGNYAADFLSTDWKWHFQADEVLHENQHDIVLAFINEIAPKYEVHGIPVEAITTQYNHFLGNYSTCFKFCYQEIPRIKKAGSAWKLSGDACHLDYGRLDTVLRSNITVYHYGKVHNGKTGWKKEWDFQQLFITEGFPDPKMQQMKEKFGEEFCDYVYLFQQDIKDGKTWKFEGTHPEVMKDRIQKFKDEGWEQFNSKLIEGVNL